MLRELKIVIDLLKKILGSEPPVAGEASNEWLVKQCLLHNVSYLLPARASRDRLIGFRVLRKSTRDIFRTHIATRQLQPGNEYAVLGGFMKHQDLITQYIELEAKRKIGWYVAKAEWPEVAGSARFRFWWKWFWFVLPFAFKCTVARNRQNFALLIRETADTALLMHWLAKNRIKHVYNFLPYELDSNLISMLCRERGITVTKIPSSGPLATHNRILICDEVAFSSPYHFEEYQLFRHSIRAGSILKWGPERAFTYLKKYMHAPVETPPYTIGYYSHGAWIRQSDDHAADGLNIVYAETKLLEDLRKFLANHPDYTLVVFPHPRERNEKRWNDTVRFYNGFLPDSGYSFAEQGVPTAMSFDKVDVAVAAFSTIVFERMFCGFKTLIGNYGIPGFPISGSTLGNICFNSSESMSAKIAAASGQSAEEFFSTNKISDYRYHNYPQYAGGVF